MIVIVILEMVMVITGVIMVVIVMIKNNFICNESIHFSFFSVLFVGYVCLCVCFVFLLGGR